MTLENQKALCAFLRQYVSENKQHKMQHALTERTNYISVILEDIYQPHNISAALRSCEGFGIQTVQVIEQRFGYKPHQGVTKGAADWLTINHYNMSDATAHCFDTLRSQGYTIVATSPHATSYTIDQFPLDRKCALVFGTEQEGLSQYALQHADAFVRIPMYGFTESFNISVSVALCLYELTQRLRASSYPWRLTPEEQVALELQWLRTHIRASAQLEELFYTQQR